MKTIFKTLGET